MAEELSMIQDLCVLMSYGANLLFQDEFYKCFVGVEETNSNILPMNLISFLYFCGILIRYLILMPIRYPTNRSYFRLFVFFSTLFLVGFPVIYLSLLVGYYKFTTIPFLYTCKILRWSVGVWVREHGRDL